MYIIKKEFDIIELFFYLMISIIYNISECEAILYEIL